MTADIYSPQEPQTIALVLRKPGVALETLFGELLARIELVLKPTLLLLDGEFAVVKIFEQLRKKGIPWNQYISGL